MLRGIGWTKMENGNGHAKKMEERAVEQLQGKEFYVSIGGL